MSTRPAWRWLLDTNVLAEPVRPAPDPVVLKRLKAHEAELAIPVTVWQEMHYGWLRMPAGARREHVGDYLQQVVARLPVLPLDTHAARIQAELRLDAEQHGRPISYPDSEIAAIAIAHGAALVTRNTKDFENRPGLQVVNWFQR